MLLLVICAIRIARWVGDRMRSRKGIGDWDDYDDVVPAGDYDEDES